MQSFIVGGAVRDDLLGIAVHDRDWVVVGATPEQMLAQGFRPVGKDFPVFLHPDTHEQYALARTERKSAPGYRGFVFHTSPDVTLEEDLVRRDLTINAIARAATSCGHRCFSWNCSARYSQIARLSQIVMSPATSTGTRPAAEYSAMRLEVSGVSSRTRTSLKGMPKATIATQGRIDHDE